MKNLETRELKVSELKNINGGWDWLTITIIEEVIDYDLNGDGNTGLDFLCIIGC